MTFRRDTRSCHGFTLVELLVVVAIIALLIAVLLPALGKAKEVGQNVRCMANIRQFDVAIGMYANDYDGQMFPMDTAVDAGWYNLLVPYIGKTGYADDPSETSMGNIGLCPKTATPPDAGAAFYKPGNAFTAWTWEYDTGSYGMNDWLAPETEAYYNSGYNTFLKEKPDYFYKTMHSAAYPAEVPTVADCNWVGGWPEENDYPPTDFVKGRIGHGRGYFMGRFALIRHMERSVNVGMVDGHVETVVLGDLWNLRWHNGWTDPLQVQLP